MHIIPTNRGTEVFSIDVVDHLDVTSSKFVRDISEESQLLPTYIGIPSFTASNHEVEVEIKCKNVA